MTEREKINVQTRLQEDELRKEGHRLAGSQVDFSWTDDATQAIGGAFTNGEINYSLGSNRAREFKGGQ